MKCCSPAEAAFFFMVLRLLYFSRSFGMPHLLRSLWLLCSSYSIDITPSFFKTLFDILSATVSASLWFALAVLYFIAGRAGFVSWNDFRVSAVMDYAPGPTVAVFLFSLVMPALVVLESFRDAPVCNFNYLLFLSSVLPHTPHSGCF